MGFTTWQRYCTASSDGRQPNFVALNRGRHLCSAGRPSRWALAHILVTSFMVALCNRADHIYFHPVSYSFFFFPRLISTVGDWMSTILRYMVWSYSVNLECGSETCCARLAGNTGHKKVVKNRHLGTIAQLCRAISSQLRHVSTIGKKLVKHQYILYMS